MYMDIEQEGRRTTASPLLQFTFFYMKKHETAGSMQTKTCWTHREASSLDYKISNTHVEMCNVHVLHMYTWTHVRVGWHLLWDLVGSLMSSRDAHMVVYRWRRETTTGPAGPATVMLQWHTCVDEVSTSLMPRSRPRKRKGVWWYPSDFLHLVVLTQQSCDC